MSLIIVFFIEMQDKSLMYQMRIRPHTKCLTAESQKGNSGYFPLFLEGISGLVAFT